MQDMDMMDMRESGPHERTAVGKALRQERVWRSGTNRR